MITFEKNQTYLEVLKYFRGLLEKEYVDGGWLPPVREMCKRLNVNNATYTKATKRLVAEGLAESFVGKGIYIIPKEYRISKIGLIYGNGEDSPFFYKTGELQTILDTLDSRDYGTQIIQGNSPENLVRNAYAHYVSGLIWLAPPRKYFASLKDINEYKLLPMICTHGTICYKEREITAETGIPSVLRDDENDHKQTMEFLATHGHQRIAYSHAGMGDANCFHNCFYIDNYIHNPGLMAESIKNLKITALVINGNSRCIKSAFEEIYSLPEELRPEVVLHDVSNLSQICKEYADIKIIGVLKKNFRNLARTAVNMLLDNLHCPEKIESVKLTTNSIIEYTG